MREAPLYHALNVTKVRFRAKEEQHEDFQLKVKAIICHIYAKFA